MASCSLFAAGCGVDLSTPPVATSDPTDLAGTWVGTLEENGGGFYETTVVFDSQGQMSAFTIEKGTPETFTGTVEGLKGSNKFFKFTLSDGNEGGLVTDSTFSHAGIIVQGFSAGVLQKWPPNDTTFGNGPYTLSDIFGVTSTTWSGNVMRVVVSGGVITSVIGKTSTVTISSDGSFTGNDQINGDILNTTGGEFDDPSNNTPSDSALGRYLGNWQNTAGTTSGVVTVLITPDKLFLGSYSCVGPTRALDNCDFHLWKK